MKSVSTSQNSSSICASMVNSWFFRIWHSPSSSWANLSVVCKRTFDLGVKWNDLKESWKKLPLLPNAGIMDFLFPIRYFLSKHIPSISAIWHSCEVEVSIDLRRELLNEVTKSDLANCGTGDSESKHLNLWTNITCKPFLVEWASLISKSRVFGDTTPNGSKLWIFCLKKMASAKNYGFMFWSIRFWAANHRPAKALWPHPSVDSSWQAYQRVLNTHTSNIFNTFQHHVAFDSVGSWLKHDQNKTPYLFSIIINFFQKQNKVPMFFIRIRILSASLFRPQRWQQKKRQHRVPSHRELTMHFFANGFGAKDVTSVKNIILRKAVKHGETLNHKWLRHVFFPFRITQLVFLPRDFIWFLHLGASSHLHFCHGTCHISFHYIHGICLAQLLWWIKSLGLKADLRQLNETSNMCCRLVYQGLLRQGTLRSTSASLRTKRSMVAANTASSLRRKRHSKPRT